MKKVIAILAVAGLMTACNNGTSTISKVDSTKVDSTKVSVDTAAIATPGVITKSVVK